MIKKIVFILVLLTIAGGLYYWFTSDKNQQPVFTDTTLEKYPAIMKASEKCLSAEKPSKDTCQKVARILSDQIKKILSVKDGKKKYKKELINLYEKLEKTHKKMGDIQTTININLKIIKLEPQVARHYSRLSAYYLKNNAHKEAIKYARLTTQLAPFRWQAFKTLGDALAGGKRYKEADEAYMKAIQLAPSNKTATLEKLRQDLSVKQSLLTEPVE